VTTPRSGRPHDGGRQATYAARPGIMSPMTSSDRSPGKPPRGALYRFLSPGPDSSTAQLRAYATVWAVLLPVWISAEWWSHPDLLRRVLYVLLSIISVTQSLSAVALLRRRR
jgi:hypothetical protein